MTGGDTLTPPASTVGNVQAAIDAGVAIATPHDVAGVQAYVLPDCGARIEIVDGEKYLANPNRKRGHVTVGTVDSLMRYVDAHRADGTSIWVDPSSGETVAVLDDHEDSDAKAGWGQYRARFQPVLTPEWQHWTSHDGDMVRQVVFAEHIEDGAREIRKPDAAAVLEIAQTFHAKRKVDYREANRLRDGNVQLVYTEETTAKAGQKGDMAIPTEIELGVSPFLGEDAYKVIARVRYRIDDGRLLIGYRLDRPDVVLRDAIEQIAERLRGRFAGMVYLGTPRAAE